MLCRRLILAAAMSTTGLCWLAPSVRGENAPDAAAVEFFEKRIRPILVEHCHKCHSELSKPLKGGLRLDNRAGLLKGGDSGAVLDTSAPDKSLLLKAIGYKDVDLQMPPKGKLPDEAIADLRAWVKMGAPWPGLPSGALSQKNVFDLDKRKREHWAWQPIRATAPPAVRAEFWPTATADRFILAKLEANGLAPAAPADKRTWLRRVSFDLTGLPPAPPEIAAFLSDGSAAAHERVVDRLLNSPHFGERWARHWLDLVRYAESRGHEFDPNIPNVWHYRDYVIRALNADVPYDQFVMEHLAGDLVAKPRTHPVEGFNESILGTGFWFLGEEVHSPVDIRGDEADRLDNRIDVFAKTFLGLTVACARCHDHKFDAISTKDYYSLLGFVESSNYRQVRFDAREHNQRVAAELAETRAKHRAIIQRALAESLRPGVGCMAEYLLAARAVVQAGTSADIAAVAEARQLEVDRLTRWVGQARLAAGDVQHPLYLWATGRVEKVLAPSDKFEIVFDYASARSGDWRPDDVAFGVGPKPPGDVHVGDDSERPIESFVEVAAAECDAAFKGLRTAPGTQLDTGALNYERAGRTIRTPTFTLTGGKIAYLVRGKGTVYAAVDSHTVIHGPLHGKLVRTFNTGTAWQWVTHDLSSYAGHKLHLEFTAHADGDLAIGRIGQGESPPALTRLVPPTTLVAAAASGPHALAIAYQKLFCELLEKLASDRLLGDPAAAELAPLANWLLENRALFGPRAHAPVTSAGRAYFEAQAKITAKIRWESRLAPAIQDGNGTNERVFVRGSHKALGEVAPRRLLEALVGSKGIEADGSGRLVLARQITDPNVNPFVTRLIVNRVWHHLFGRGIVASTDNFGVMGDAPTHPELLDFLAEQFARDGWSIKHLIRTLVLSSAYRMASVATREADAADQENRLLHKMRMRRLEGESIRDAMLAVSGRLEPKQFGPPVPLHLTEFLEGRGRPTSSGPLDGDGRRSIYIAVRRNFLSPLMLAFDSPSPFSTVGRRTVSNVPAQALILLNDPFVHQQAGVWAKRTLGQPGTTQERVSGMFESAFGRLPTGAELAECVDFIDGTAKSDGTDAAWKSLAHVLFNAKEFIYLP